MGCRPWAGSVLHCHCVLALREDPLTGAVQDESQLQEVASKLEAGSAGRQANWRFEANFYSVQKATFGTMGCRPRRQRQFRKQRQASWKLAVQEGKQIEGLKL